MGPYHPECPDRLHAIGDRLISAGLDVYLRHFTAVPAAREHLERVHAPVVRRRDRGRQPRDGAVFHRSRHGAQPALPCGGPPRCRRRRAGHRSRHARRVPARVLRGAPARPPRGAAPRDGLLPVQQRRRRRRPRDRGARRRSRGDRRFRRAPRQRDRRHLQRRRARADGGDVPASAVSVFRHRESGAEHGERAPRGGQRLGGVSRRSDAALAPGAGSAQARYRVHLGGLRCAPRGPARGLALHRVRLRVGHARAHRASPTGMRRGGSCRASKAAIRSRRSVAAWPSICAS